MAGIRYLLKHAARDWIFFSPLFWAGMIVGYYSMYGMGHLQHGTIWVIIGFVPILGIAFSLTPRYSRKIFNGSYAKSLKLRGDERVIDFGCGSGVLSKHLVRLLPYGHLTCIDIDAHALANAKRRLEGLCNVDFVREDIRNLPRPAEPYDVVVVQFVLHDLPRKDLETTLKAMAGWLRRGAVLHLREPKEYIEATELKVQLRDAGFTDGESRTARVPLMGDYYGARDIIQARYVLGTSGETQA